MEVAWPASLSKRWVARVGDRASKPLALDAAKRTAVAMLREKGKAEPRDWIAELNQIAANEAGRAALAQEQKQWPLDLMGGGKRPGSMQIDGELRDAILHAELSRHDQELAEPLQGDDWPLEYDSGAIPKSRNASGGRHPAKRLAKRREGRRA
jgi:hypothetical protein